MLTTNIGVPLYPLFQNLQFQLSAVYSGMTKKWKIKEVNGSQVSKRAPSENRP
jgi:hypothetical protein